MTVESFIYGGIMQIASQVLIINDDKQLVGHLRDALDLIIGVHGYNSSFYMNIDLEEMHYRIEICTDIPALKNLYEKPLK